MADQLPYELGDLGPARSNAEADQSYPAGPSGQEERVPSPLSPTPSGLRNERQRVRFNSSAANPPPATARSPSRDRALSPSAIRRPRPALSRNPNSYNSVTSDFVHDEPLSPAKAKSAAEAARRAQALAVDAHKEEDEVPETAHERHGSYDMSGRWSPESEPVTEVSYTGEPVEHTAHQSFMSGVTGPTGTTGGARQSAVPDSTEARELLRAHWKFPTNQDANHIPGMRFYPTHFHARFI